MKSASHTAPRFSFRGNTPPHAAPIPEKPSKPAPPCPDDHCPYCQRALPGTGASVAGLLQLGVKQLFGAIYMIVAGIIRCVRFAAAGLLCLIGLLGSCCFGLASRIAHRDDRKLLFRQ